jgi:hypothetical protein
MGHWGNILVFIGHNVGGEDPRLVWENLIAVMLEGHGPGLVSLDHNGGEVQNLPRHEEV